VNRRGAFLTAFTDRMGRQIAAGVAGAVLLSAACAGALAASQREKGTAENSKPEAAAAISPGGATRELSLSLSDAVFLALRNNPSIRSAYVDRIAQKFDLRVAEDVFTPHASLNGGISRQRLGGLTANQATIAPTVSVLAPTGAQFGFVWDNSASASAGVATRSSVLSMTMSQPLLRGAGLDVNMAPVRAARLGEHINQLNLRLTVSTTIANVIMAYRALMLSQEAKKLAEDSVVRAQALIDIDNSLIQAGRMARMEIVQAQADLENQNLAVLQGEQQVEAARLSLATLLDLNLGTRIAIREKLEPARAAASLDDALKIALNRRPDYLGQLDVVEQGRLGVTIADNQRLWDLSLVGSAAVGKQFVNGGGLPPSKNRIADASIGLNLTGPLNDLTAEQSAVHAAGSLQDAEIQLSVIRQGVEQQVRSAVIGIDLQWRQLDVAKRALGYAAVAVDIEKQKLSVGKSSNFQVQSLEANRRQTESQKLNAEIGYLNALTNFDLELGTTLDTWKISLRD
jgi:outer membrane protein TolC